METWEVALTALTRALLAGRLGVVPADAEHASHLVERLSTKRERVSLGYVVAHEAEDPADILSKLRSLRTLSTLTEIDVLFQPELGIDVVDLLRQQARRSPLIVLWPGPVVNGRLTYSASGRADQLDERAYDCIILHPVATTFPDEIPYRMEIIRP